MAAVPRIYARALFEAAREQDKVAPVRDELRQLVDALGTTPELEQFLANPQIDPTAKAEVLEQVTEGAEPLVRNTARLLASKGRAGELRAVAAEYDAFVDRSEGRVQVELTTAQELSTTRQPGSFVVSRNRPGARSRRRDVSTRRSSVGSSCRRGRYGSTPACAAGWSGCGES